MELSNATLHVIVAVLVILTAAVVAFVCDLLKGTVERLRLQNAQLQAIHAEAGLAPVPAPVARITPPAITRKAEVPAAPISAPLRAAQPQRNIEKPVAPAEVPAIETKPATAPAPAVAVQPWASQEALDRGSALAQASGRARRPRREVTWASPDELMQYAMGGPRKSTRSETPSEVAGRTAQADAGKTEQVAPAASAAPARLEAPAAEAPVRNLMVVHRGEAKPASFEAPRGFVDRSVLIRRKRSSESFTGTVMMVSASNFQMVAEKLGKGSAEEALRAVRTILESLAGEKDYFCRSGEDEFVLVTPETGLAAKRRVDQLAERLWDHQLRNLGPASLSFQWGSAQANAEAFGDVYAEAQSRMEEGRRRTRPVEPLKIAVNG